MPLNCRFLVSYLLLKLKPGTGAVRVPGYFGYRISGF